MALKTHLGHCTSAWCPYTSRTGLLAAGTLGGTIDIDFDSSSTLELFGTS